MNISYLLYQAERTHGAAEQREIDASAGGIVVQFVPQPPVDPKRVLQLVQSSRIYRLPGPDRVRIEMKHEDMKMRSNEVRQFLKKLA